MIKTILTSILTFGIIIGIILAFGIFDITGGIYCKNHGFSFGDTIGTYGIEPGYIKCCNRTYVNHAKVYQCEVLPYN